MRTWKKIEETKKRATEVMRLKARNNDHIQQKIERLQYEEMKKSEQTEMHARNRQQTEQEKAKIQQAILMHKQEETAKTKMKMMHEKQRHEQNMHFIAQKNHMSKEQVRIQEQIAKQKIDEARMRRIQETRQ